MQVIIVIDTASWNRIGGGDVGGSGGRRCVVDGGGIHHSGSSGISVTVVPAVDDHWHFW